jgi:CO/xanthine dehydrogenase Mo-binding subunit
MAVDRHPDPHAPMKARGIGEIGITKRIASSRI